MFADYLFVSLTSAIAFSPTDAMPYSRWAKLIMGSGSGDIHGDHRHAYRPSHQYATT